MDADGHFTVADHKIIAVHLSVFGSRQLMTELRTCPP